MSQTRTHQLKGRKRKKWIGKIGNVVHHKSGLTPWRGGRGKSRLMSLKMWHITDEDSLSEGKEEGGVGW
jgi:hypothetical protein